MNALVKFTAHVPAGYFQAALAEARALANAVKRLGAILLENPPATASANDMAAARRAVVLATAMTSAYEAAHAALAGQPLHALAPQADRRADATTIGDTPQ